MIAQTNTLPDAVLSVNAAALLLRARGLRPNTRYSVLAAIARRALSVAARSQWGVLLRRNDVERYADELAMRINDKAVTSA